MDVSVIIPCSKNHRRYLGELFDKLSKQTFRGEWEIILVVDGEKSDDLDSIKNNNIRIYFSNAKSSAVNRNIGIKKAEGKIIAFIDSDCVPREDWLENLIKPLDEYDGSQGIDYSYGDTYLGKFLEKQQLDYLYGLVENGLCKFVDTRNFAIRANVLDKVGYFDESLPTSVDRDLGYRLFKAGFRVVLNEKAVLYHRWGKGSLSGFFKWGIWYGRGDYIFSRKWPELGKNGLRSIFIDIRSSFFYLIKALRSSGDARGLNLLFSARQLGVAFGKLKAMLFKT